VVVGGGVKTGAEKKDRFGVPVPGSKQAVPALKKKALGGRGAEKKKRQSGKGPSGRGPGKKVQRYVSGGGDKSDGRQWGSRGRHRFGCKPDGYAGLITKVTRPIWAFEKGNNGGPPGVGVVKGGIGTKTV